MAKKQQSSKRKVVAFSVKGWNTAHYTHTEQYAKMVETLFRRAEADIVFGVANVNPDAGKVFSFDDYPGAKRMVAKTISELTANVTTVISKGSRKEWLFACQKNDAFLASILDTSKLTSKRLALMQDRNLDGLKAFQERKVDGMDLSKRVWKYTDQFKDQLELALDAGLGEGRSADQLSRDVRQNLKDPNRLFRRVRDKHGNLVLSKAAKAFHPGQGVYRSSYKNAMRLTRSEINMAYREADWQRWQQLDFVVGIEIQRSKNIKCDCPLCDRLAGKYPKQFKFKGWHPQCMCYVTPVLMDDETFNQNELADLKAAFRGTQAKHFQSKDAVTDVPDGFKEWVKDNVESQKYWKNTPYFVRDNFVSGELSKGLKPLLAEIRPGIEAPKPIIRVPFNELDEQAKRKWQEFRYEIREDFDFDSACRLYNIKEWDEYRKHCGDAFTLSEWWREDELRAERARVKDILMAEIARCKVLAEQGFKAFEVAAQGAEQWIGDDANDSLKRARVMFADEQGEPYPNYKTFVNSINTGFLNVAQLQRNIERAKTAYQNAINNANATIAKYGADHDVSKVVALTKETLSLARPAVVITKEIEKAIKDVEKSISPLGEQLDSCAKKSIEFREVKKYDKQPTEQELIDKIGGGDLTTGSCSSLAFAWAANKGGLDVTDFRGGESQKFFSSGINIWRIADAVGGINEWMSGVEAMKKCEIGKEYYCAIARHAAIIRQVSKGEYEYLELQSGRKGGNGWHKLNASAFANRFSARGRRQTQLIDIELLYKCADYQKLMGYINTAEDAQKKGEWGSIK